MLEVVLGVGGIDQSGRYCQTWTDRGEEKTGS